VSDQLSLSLSGDVARLPRSLRPMLPKASGELLEAFLQHLRVDRGVSARTLVNYRLDVVCFLEYLAVSSKDPLKIRREDLTEYLWHRKSAGMQPASVETQPLLAGILPALAEMPPAFAGTQSVLASAFSPMA